MIASYLGARVGKAEVKQIYSLARSIPNLIKLKICVMVRTLIKMQHSMLKQMLKKHQFQLRNNYKGKELSYNNIADTDAALECVKSFAKTCLCHR